MGMDGNENHHCGRGAPHFTKGGVKVWLFDLVVGTAAFVSFQMQMSVPSILPEYVKTLPGLAEKSSLFVTEDPGRKMTCTNYTRTKN